MLTLLIVKDTREVMMQRHARISRGNPPVPLELNTYTSVPLWIELRQADTFEHWLVMHFLKYVFWIFLTP